MVSDRNGKTFIQTHQRENGARLGGRQGEDGRLLQGHPGPRDALHPRGQETRGPQGRGAPAGPLLGFFSLLSFFLWTRCSRAQNGRSLREGNLLWWTCMRELADELERNVPVNSTALVETVEEVTGRQRERLRSQEPSEGTR